MLINRATNNPWIFYFFKLENVFPLRWYWSLCLLLGLWGLVNNAGIIGQLGQVVWLEVDDYKKCFDVNLHGLIDTTVTFLPLIKRERGRIVNIASIFGRTAATSIAPYVLSKYAIEAYSDILRYTCWLVRKLCVLYLLRLLMCFVSRFLFSFLADANSSCMAAQFI